MLWRELYFDYNRADDVVSGFGIPRSPVPLKETAAVGQE
jgi:hypothetical protein